VTSTRVRLGDIYASRASDAEKHNQKLEAFAAMGRAYQAGAAKDPALAAYQRLVLAAVEQREDRGRGVVHRPRARIQALLREQGDDLPRFYARVRQLAKLAKPERDRILEAYARTGHAPAGTRASLR